MATRISRRRALEGLAAAAVAAPAVAQAQEPVVLKGMILQRDGARILLRSAEGERFVRVEDDTKIESVGGAFGMKRQSYAPTDLIPGLPVEVTGVRTARAVVASAITFKPGDLKTARQIQAGLHGAEQRLASVGEFVPVGRAKVYFATGSSTLSPKGKQELMALAAKAKNYPGYRLAVVGGADPTGSPEANQRLSEARAAAVTAFLLQSAGVRPGSILPPTALESPIFEDPDPPATAAEARRVTVTLAASKASQQARSPPARSPPALSPPATE